VSKERLPSFDKATQSISLSVRSEVEGRGVVNHQNAGFLRTPLSRSVEVPTENQLWSHFWIAKESICSLQLGARHQLRKAPLRISSNASRQQLEPSPQPGIAEISLGQLFRDAIHGQFHAPVYPATHPSPGREPAENPLIIFTLHSYTLAALKDET
jgi:hypothetical protein